MLTKFDHAVFKAAGEMNTSSSLLYVMVEQHPNYKGYRDRHSEDELLQMLKDVVQMEEIRRCWASVGSG